MAGLVTTTFRQKAILIVCGLVIGLVILESGLRIGGAVYLYFQERANIASLREKGELVIMCLGESTTQAGGENSYPRQLEEILSRKGFSLAVTVINKGISGTDTAKIAAGLMENIECYHPDIVITMMGINDNPKTPVFEKDSPAKTWFFQELRVCKLFNLLKENIAYIIDMREENRHSNNEQRAGGEENTPLDQQQGIDSAADSVETREDSESFLSRGDHLLLQGRLEEAGEWYSLAAGAEPGEVYHRYVGLARTFHRQKDDLDKAEKYYQKAVELQPGNDIAYATGGDGLIPLYREQGKWEEAAQLAQWVISVNPNNALAYSELGRCYERRGKMEDAVRVYYRALELQPFHNQPFAILTHYFNQRGEYEKAVEVCHLRLTKNPNDEATNAALALTYFQAGDEEQAQYYFARTAALRENFNPPTVLNYRRVIEILQERGIQAVCVQYPMRNVGDLKNMLSGYENIIFVDNEKVFKAALFEGKYWEYFEDQFAGDFGHCTPQGNRLLAENVAAVLGKTCFKTLIPVGD